MEEYLKSMDKKQKRKKKPKLHDYEDILPAAGETLTEKEGVFAGSPV